MKKKIFSLVTIAALAVTTVLGTTSAFANNQMQNMPKMNHERMENVVLGKITAIDANSITIAVATRSNITRQGNMPNQNGNGNTPPEKPNGNGNTPPEKPNGNGNTPPEMPNDANGFGQNNNGQSLEKPNMDNMYTLTGETKVISLQGAKFEKNQKPQKNDNNANNTNTQKTYTYSDFAVGDYVNIEMTDKTSNIAKTVREAGGFMGGEGGPRNGGFGSKNKKNNTNE